MVGSNALSGPAKAITIYVDADACPVKAEIYRVAERYSIKVYVVSNSAIAVPRTPLIVPPMIGSRKGSRAAPSSLPPMSRLRIAA